MRTEDEADELKEVVEQDHNASLLENKCNECDETFFDEDILEMHKKSHKDRNNFKCETCGKTFF